MILRITDFSLVSRSKARVCLGLAVMECPGEPQDSRTENTSSLLNVISTFGACRYGTRRKDAFVRGERRAVALQRHE